MTLKVIPALLLALCIAGFSYATDYNISNNDFLDTGSKQIRLRSDRIEPAATEYAERAKILILRNWIAPQTDARQKVIVNVRISGRGEIIVEGITQSSENAEFDQSCLKAIEKSSPLSVPPGEIHMALTFSR